MTQYNYFAKPYDEWTKSSLRKYAWEETVKKNIKDVKGKRVLDVACGSGSSIEIIYSLGAKEVVGIDVSSEVINIAKKKFPENKFLVKDISCDSFDELNKFDIITAIFLFEYAQKKEILVSMIRNISQLIYPGGNFYSLTIDPFAILKHDYYYGIKATNPQEEGKEYFAILHNDKREALFKVGMFFWSFKTIKEILKEEGFSEIKLLPVFVSNQGIREYGEDFWKDFFKSPVYLMISAKKK